MKQEHELKCHRQYFNDVWYGRKPYEVRYDDRGYAVGDVLILRDYDPQTDNYSGASIRALVTHILRGFVGLQQGYIVMGIFMERDGRTSSPEWEATQ